MSAEAEEHALLAALVSAEELETVHPRDAGLAAAANRIGGRATGDAEARVAALRRALKSGSK